MSPEAQRIAIAELRGWKYRGPEAVKEVAWACWSAPDSPEWELGFPPDYLNDLNAIHEAEKVLKDTQWSEYIRLIVGESEAKDWPTYFLNLEGVRIAAHASSAQRAEAFLRALNLWDDSK